MPYRTNNVTTAALTTTLIALALLGGCTADSGGGDLSKDEVQNLGDDAKADGVDFCENYGWYGDGECDTFCPLADQDCSGEACTVGADSTCAEGERCMPGYCEFWCPADSASCCEPASCQPDDGCSSDADCADSSWCRETPEGDFACAGFVGEGDSCGGFTPPWAFQRCAPGLRCDEPIDPDGPTDMGGVCVIDGPTEVGCMSDADCDDAAWCRETRSGDFTCTNFALEGDSCGGFTPPWAYEQCAPGLECDEPTDSDGPTDIGGVCIPAGPEDCRDTGCLAGEYCAFCWATFACIPNGAVC